MPVQLSCPDRALLRDLLDGALPDDDQAALTAHLDGCPDCQAALEELAGGAWACPPRTEGFGPESALFRAIDALQEATGAEAPAEFASDEDFAVRYLGPSDRPGALGRFGPYDVLAVIGRGGMGLVLKGFDPDLNRLVAIKVLAPQFAGCAAYRRRFVREARAAAAVSHEHVVAIHDVDVSGELPYLVMEYVPGLSLQERLDRDGPLALEEILRIGSQTASGLAAAHAQGLIHRDVKPANILLEDGMERVQLTDFGLARAIDDASLTQSGTLAGTPQYMAPEQARAGTLDHRADLFSLGGVLYAMAAGRPPFPAPTAMGVLHRVCEDEPTPLAKANPELPRWLGAIIGKLLAKEPAHRFQSAAEVADLLGRCLAHVRQPKLFPLPRIPRRPQTAAAAPRRPGWPVRLVLAAAAAVVALLLAGGTVMRIRTAEGTLVIETDDPAVKVSVDGDEVTITGAGVQEIKLKPGKHQVLASKDGQVKEEVITITRGGKEVVKVTLERAAPAPAAGGPLPVPQIPQQAARLPVSQAAFSPDGKLLALGRADGSVALLEVASGRVLRMLQGHKVRILTIQFFPDGKVLISVGGDGSVLLWDAATGKQLSAVQLPQNLLLGAVSPDGKAFVGAAEGKPAHVWEVASGKQLAVLGGDAAVQALAFSPDGKQIAGGNAPGIVRLWDAVSGKAVVRLEAPRAARSDPGVIFVHPSDWMGTWNVGHDRSIVFSPDGKLLASGTGEPTIHLWDVASGRMVRSLGGEEGHIVAVAFSPDGRLLASAKDDHAIRLWDLATGQAVHGGGRPTLYVTSMAFSPDGKFVVVTEASGGVWLWHVTTGKRTDLQIPPADGGADRRLFKELEDARAREAEVHRHAQQQVLRAQEDARRTLYAQNVLLALREWQAAEAGRARQLLDDTPPEQRGWEWHYLKRLIGGGKPTVIDLPGPASAVAFSPDGKTVAAAADHVAQVWDAATGGVVTPPIKHDGVVQTVAFSPDGKLLALGCPDGIIPIWDLKKGGSVAEWKGGGNVHAIAFSPDGKLLALGLATGQVAFWEPLADKPVSFVGTHADAVHAVAFSPDGKLLASGGIDRKVRLWETATGREVRQLAGHDRALTAVAFSPDGRRLATCGEDGTTLVWDVVRGKILISLKGHAGPVSGVAFSPDGHRLATCGADKTVKLWDASSGQLVLTLAGHTGAVTGVAFSPDGRRLASSGADKTVRIWDATLLVK